MRYLAVIAALLAACGSPRMASYQGKSLAPHNHVARCVWGMYVDPRVPLPHLIVATGVRFSELCRGYTEAEIAGCFNGMHVVIAPAYMDNMALVVHEYVHAATANFTHDAQFNADFSAARAQCTGVDNAESPANQS